MTRTALFTFVAIATTLIVAGCTIAFGADSTPEALPQAHVEVVYDEVEINAGYVVVIGDIDEMEAEEYVAQAR